MLQENGRLHTSTAWTSCLGDRHRCGQAIRTPIKSLALTCKRTQKKSEHDLKPRWYLHKLWSICLHPIISTNTIIPVNFACSPSKKKKKAREFHFWKIHESSRTKERQSSRILYIYTRAPGTSPSDLGILAVHRHTPASPLYRRNGETDLLR